MKRRNLIPVIILVFVIGLTACGRNNPSDVNGPVKKQRKKRQKLLMNILMRTKKQRSEML